MAFAVVISAALLTTLAQARDFPAAISPSATTGSQWQALLLAIQQNPALTRQLRASPGGPTLAALEDDCSAVRAENLRLKQLLATLLSERTTTNSQPRLQGKELLAQALTGGVHSPTQRSQRELSPAQRLLNQVAQRNVAGGGSKPWTAVQQVLVTPTATWSEVVQSSTYLTTVSSDVTTELPILLRGSKVTTTIVEPSMFTGEEEKEIGHHRHHRHRV